MSTNLMNNPFDGLNSNQALKEAKKILTTNLEFDEFQIRRLQLKNSQCRAYTLAEEEGLTEKWEEIEEILKEKKEKN
jgi:hypothetical protein